MNLRQLNFPSYEFRIQNTQQKNLIFDIIRKKFVTLTPEEWVRQHVVHYLIHEKGVSPNRIAVEYALTWNGMNHRCDVLVFDAGFNPWLIVECKAADVAVNQPVFDQIARYNMKLKVPLLMVSNGLLHVYARINFDDKTVVYIPELPVS